jgi:hypothetical protein
MPRLYRPAIPVEVKCRVLLRQLGEMWPDKVIDANRPRRDAGYMVGVVGLRGRSLGRLLTELLERLADLLHCKIEDLRLDHDPALGTRQQFKNGLGKVIRYVPDANDPEHLRYRPHGAQFEGSHDVKTRIRGDHGQYSDITLIKRERRRNRKKTVEKSGKRTSNFSKPMKSAVKKKFRWPKRSFEKRSK